MNPVIPGSTRNLVEKLCCMCNTTNDWILNQVQDDDNQGGENGRQDYDCGTGGDDESAAESVKAARYVADFAAKLPNVEVIFVDPVDFNFPGDGNDPEGKDPRYTAIVEKADAFFIVTPEYNHSFPGSLKRMLDSELALYNHKPVAFAGASNGNWGGVRAVESLLTAVRENWPRGAQLGCLFPQGARYIQ